MNRLVDATSPYLIQHASNPVDWWPWGEDAFAEARRRDVPVLISIGYAACHWCHVMAHESFEDEGIARLVNDVTVPVKVDREERPDVDAVYMTATQAMTGQGGWPMTVFATPDGEPFFCGTYFPREHFGRLVRAVAEAWRERRDAVLDQGSVVAGALRRAAVPAGGEGAPDGAVLAGAVRTLAGEFDARNGGFGGAPKFPPSMVLEFLLRHHARTGDAQALRMVRETCHAMARGGIYDQVGGGFARYSVDGGWGVPHFEKMLYDNALLLRVYTGLWRRTGDPLARRVAAETVRFLLDEMRAGPAFAASLDADTDGVEGLTYVWTPAQLADALGAADGAWAAELLTVTAAGNFEHGTSVPRLPVDPDDAGRWRSVRERLAAARAGRPQPGRDDKVVTAWNAMAVTALLEFGQVADALGDTDGPAGEARAAGLEALEFLVTEHLVDGRPRRASRRGVVGVPAGVLEDHGCLAQACCVAHQVTGDGWWLELAGGLLELVGEHFADGRGGFFDTADDAERLITRPADATDNASPSGLSATAEALVSHGALVGDPAQRERAEAALAVAARVAASHPRFAGQALAVAEALLAGPFEVAVAGAGDGAEALVRAAWRAGSPGAVIVAGRPDEPGVPLLADRPLVGGAAAAYVCRGFVCDRPLTRPAELGERLGAPTGTS